MLSMEVILEQEKALQVIGNVEQNIWELKIFLPQHKPMDFPRPQ